jgi:hypothetical protein
MKAIVTAFLSGISTIFSFATTYTTIQDGAWSDVAIWSTDGVNPCGCRPSFTLSGDTVVIRNSVIQDATLELENYAYMHVEAGAFLDGTGDVMSLSNAQVLMNGTVSSRKLTVGDGAVFTVQLAELNIITRLEVFGVLHVTSSNLNVEQGNVIINPGAVFDLQGGSRLHFITGNFQNSGTTNLGVGSCIRIDAGNIHNETSGIVSGGGSMITDAGNVSNDGSWDVNILWCSAGFDFGMPSPENCIAANENCMAVPLPVELVVFEGTARPGCNNIVWITATEYNCDYFVLERSDEGEVWTERAVVNGAGTTSLESYYEVCDNITEPKVYYYRLKQYDYNRDHTISNVIAIHSVYWKPTEMYPNPSTGEFFLLLDGYEQGMEVIIYDMSGNQVYRKDQITDEKVAFQLQLHSGLYLVHINRKGKVETLKLVIR